MVMVDVGTPFLVILQVTFSAAGNMWAWPRDRSPALASDFLDSNPGHGPFFQAALNVAVVLSYWISLFCDNILGTKPPRDATPASTDTSDDRGTDRTASDGGTGQRLLGSTDASLSGRRLFLHQSVGRDGRHADGVALLQAARPADCGCDQHSGEQHLS